MSEALETINEADDNIENEEAPPEPIEETIKNEVKQEETANEEPEFKNKTDRMKHKKVNCTDCGANLTLKTMR